MTAVKPRDESFDRPCPVCGAEPNHGCIEDGVEHPMTWSHLGRAFDRPGPITVRHTGQFNADGGAILEVVEPPDDGT